MFEIMKTWRSIVNDKLNLDLNYLKNLGLQAAKQIIDYQSQWKSDLQDFMIFDEQFSIWVEDSLKQHGSESIEILKIKTAKTEEAKLRAKVINID
jgi:hypothetical protein